MAEMIIGKVKAGSGKMFEVRWNQSDKNVYVSYGGWTLIGKANSASEAMVKAEAWTYNK